MVLSAGHSGTYTALSILGKFRPGRWLRPATASAPTYQGHPDQPFGAVSYAQFGEDLILCNLFAALGIARPSYLDVGAHHPLNCSNTALLYSRGARGVCVEPNPMLIPAFREMRPEDVTLNIGCGVEEGALEFYMIDQGSGRNTFDKATAEAFVRAHPEFCIREVRKIPVLPLDEIVRRHFGDGWPDLLSIDAEGMDLPILRASVLNAAIGPRVICVEAVSGDGADESGSLRALLVARGYVGVARTLGNLIFAARQPWSD